MRTVTATDVTRAFRTQLEGRTELALADLDTEVQLMRATVKLLRDRCNSRLGPDGFNTVLRAAIRQADQS